jgi:asparagine synthase (glutamine-hydrolysing)
VYNEDKSVVVVLNGEIYNYRELRSRLVANGHRFTTDGDTEVIAHLYEEEGADCVKSMAGMFGVAIWDARKEELILARDRLGKKPLFYSNRRGAISFASELWALLADEEIPREIDPAALDRFFMFTYVPAPHSAFRAVRKIPPATILRWRDGKTKIERYWRLDYSSQKLKLGSEAEAGEVVRDALRAATRRRLLADVPIGAFLSGGIDSTAVVASMAENSSGPVKTFSIGFEAEGFDELPYAREVADRFGTDHHEFVVKPDIAELLPMMTRHYGEPFADHSAIPSFYLAKMARRHVTVALNGDGGDEAFGGYGRYSNAAIFQALDRIPIGLRRGIASAAGRIRANGDLMSARSRMSRASTLLPLSPQERYLSAMSRFGLAMREGAYTPEFSALLDESPADVISAPWESSKAGDLIDRMLDVDQQTYLPGDLLVKMDIATMAYGLEARSPLLDHELVQLAMVLPSRYKVQGSRLKIALRTALRGLVPDALIDRTKHGFQVPMAEWFRTELCEMTRDTLLGPEARSSIYLRRDMVRELFDRHLAHKEDNSALLWNFLMFELWQQQVVEKSSTATRNALVA